MLVFSYSVTCHAATGILLIGIIRHLSDKNQHVYICACILIVAFRTRLYTYISPEKPIKCLVHKLSTKSALLRILKSKGVGLDLWLFRHKILITEPKRICGFHRCGIDTWKFHWESKLWILQVVESTAVLQHSFEVSFDHNFYFRLRGQDMYCRLAIWYRRARRLQINNCILPKRSFYF